MIADRIEGKWIDLFADVFARCKVGAGDVCAVLSESQSRALNVQLAELALARLGARPFHVVVPTARQTAPVPIRSTGASVALARLAPAIGALAASTFVADCTLEGLMHAAELPQMAARAAGTDRPPDIYHFVFDRLASDEILARHFGVEPGIGRFLGERGFYVAEASHSNYPMTGHSLASMFYMDYLGLLADPRVAGDNWQPVYEMVSDHRVARFLRARGYDLVQFGGWWRGTYDNPLADADGNVWEAAVDSAAELVEMVETSRQYQNNVQVLDTAKGLINETLRLGQ